MKIQRRGSLDVKDTNYIPREVSRWQEKKRQFQKQAENMNKLRILFQKVK